jgi:hypothetical protein
MPDRYERRPTPEILLDILGWQLRGDHAVAGAVWHMNHAVFERYNGSAQDAVQFLRSTHRCGDIICGSTPVTAYEMPAEGVFFYYELKDPSIPAERGVLSGILRLGSEFYRVQGVNYSAKNGTRDELFRILHTVRPATAGEAASPPVSAPDPAPGGEWGIRFSGESDDSLMQDMDSAHTVTSESPPAPRSPETMPPPPPAPAPAAAPRARPAPPAPKRSAPVPTLTASAPKRPEALPPSAPPPKPKRPAAKSAKPAAARRPKPRPPALAARTEPPKESFPKLSPLPTREVPAPAPAAALEDLDSRLIHNPLPDLIEMLRHENPRVRARAADILGERGDAAAAAVPRLIETLDDKDARVRSSAALALGNIGPKALPAAEKLREVARDRNADVSMSARTALERLAGR